LNYLVYWQNEKQQNIFRGASSHEMPVFTMGMNRMGNCKTPSSFVVGDSKNLTSTGIK
jgi:hypothetical protein